MPSHRAVHVVSVGAPHILVDVDTGEPGPGQAIARGAGEERPLTQAAKAYAVMDEGRARYRMVLTM
ncbi:MAG: hypothetical protein ABI253_03975 [Mycobacterium sp.]